MSRDAGGSKDSQKHRRLHWSKFSRFAARIGHTLKNVNEVEGWVLEYFVWFLVAGAMKPGTLANYRASISVIQTMAGQDTSDSTRIRALQFASETLVASRISGRFVEIDDMNRRWAQLNRLKVAGICNFYCNFQINSLRNSQIQKVTTKFCHKTT